MFLDYSPGSRERGIRTAAIREVKEETGIDVSLSDFAGFIRM
ncbi:NUDIX domain-containing protein [Paenibacillus sp. IHB B 3084]